MSAYWPGRDRQPSSRGGEFLAGRDDLRVDQAERLLLVVRHQIDDDEPQALTDLRRSQADPRGLVHGGEHAGDQVAHQIGVGRLDRSGARFEELIRRDQDRQRLDRC